MSVMAYLEQANLLVLPLPSVCFMLDSFHRSSWRFLQLHSITLLRLLLICLITVVWLMPISAIIRRFLSMTLSFLLLQILLTNMVNQFILNVVVMKSGKFSDDFIAKFHPYAPTYDPEKDLMQVEPAMAIDLKEVYNTGIVPAGAPSFVDRYNDCEDPNSIVGRPRNDFDADRMVAGVNEAIRESKQSESKG